MRPSHILLMLVCPLALSLYSITPACGDDPRAEFTIAFEWAAKPTLTLSKGQGDTYRVTLDVDSAPSNRLPGLLAKLDKHHAPKVALVQTTLRDQNTATAQMEITFEPIPSGEVGATLKLLVELLDLQAVTMDANVFEDKNTSEILKLLRADDSISRDKDVILQEIDSAIKSSLPEANPQESGWKVDIKGYHWYEPVK